MKPGGHKVFNRGPRLFLATFMPPEIAAQLEAAQGKIVGKYWRPTHKDQFHLTWVFLGNPDQDRLRKIGFEAAKTCQAFAARLRGTGFFPNEGSPRVWFAKLEAEELATTHQALSLAFGVPAEEKFKAHITLARKKGASPRPPPVSFDQSVPIDRFELISSTLTSAGPIYQTLEEFKLPH